MIAPIAPFISDEMYINLTGEKTVNTCLLYTSFAVLFYRKSAGDGVDFQPVDVYQLLPAV